MSTPQPSIPQPGLPPGARPVVCVDVGGTKLAVCLADATGLHARVVEPPATRGDNMVVAQQIIRMVDQSCASAGLTRADIGSVGVSACGPFVFNQGQVEIAPPNLCGGLAGAARGLPNDWTRIPLRAPLQAAFGTTVRVENDAIAALVAERRWGALQGMDHCAYVTWSTGVGFGLCVDGHVLRGKNGNAGHVGHTFVSDHLDGLCGCGNVGDVEGLVAGNAIGRRFAPQGYTDAAMLFEAAYAGDTRAGALLDDVCRVMGRALYNLVVTLDLQRIAIGGSVFWNHRERLLPRLQAALDGHLPALTNGVDIVAAGLGPQVGDWAACALVSG
jgi:glucokinase